MAVSRVSDAEYATYQQRRLAQMEAEAPDPLEPFRVAQETRRLEEMEAAAPDPLEQQRVQAEQAKFLRFEAEAPDPLAAFASQDTPPPAPAASSQPVPAPPDGMAGPSGAPAEPLPTYPDQAEDPVQRTLSYLKSLDAKEAPQPDAAAEMAKFKAMEANVAPKALGAEFGPEARVPEEEPPEPVSPEVPFGQMNWMVRAPGGPVVMPATPPTQTSKPTENERQERNVREGRAPITSAEQAFGPFVGPASEEAAAVLRGDRDPSWSGAAKVAAGVLPVGDFAGPILDQGEALPGQVGDVVMPAEQAARRTRLGDTLGEVGSTLIRPSFGADTMAGRGVKAAGEVAGDIGGGVLRAGGDSRPGVVFHDEIVIPKSPGEFRKFWDRSRNVIASMGDGGKELAKRVHDWREGYETQVADWVIRMPTVREISKDRAAFANMVDVLEGTAAPASARVAKAAEEAKAILDEVYAYADNAGVKLADRIENYFPHRYDESILDQVRDGKRRKEIAEHLLATGQAKDSAEAVEIMQRYVTAARDRRHGSLEMARIADLPGYEKTPEALYGHLASAARRIFEVAQFGPDDAIANRLLKQIGDEGRDIDTARSMFQTIVRAKSYDDTPLKGLATGLRKYNALTRLGWAAVANATQSVNTATVAGVVNTMKAAAKGAWTKEEQEFALKAGVTLDSVLKELQSGSGHLTGRLTGAAMPLFNEVETFNRTVAAVAGRDYAREMARLAAQGKTRGRRALETMGLDVDAIVKRGGRLTGDEEITAARNVVERTQFRVDPQDLPGWVDSPWGRVVAQFRTFSYNQTAFLAREVLQPALNGDARPLVRFAILAPLATFASVEARNAGQLREPEEDPTKRVAQYVLGPLGLAGDVTRAVLPINAERLPAERHAAMMVGFLGGPTAGTLTEGAGAIANIERGNWTPVGRAALRQIPVVGSPLQNALLPYEKKYVMGGGRSDRRDDRNDRRSSRRDDRGGR